MIRVARSTDAEGNLDVMRYGRGYRHKIIAIISLTTTTDINDNAHDRQIHSRVEKLAKASGQHEIVGHVAI